MRQIYILLLAAVLLLAGCNYEPLPAPEPIPAKRVFLMYDNIGEWFDGDVAEAGAAVAAGALDPDERVVVYERMTTGNVIYELVRDLSTQTGFTKIERKRYARGEHSSLSMESINAVLSDIRALFPENPRWGFAFGSHGLGWVPRSNTVQIFRRGADHGQTQQHPFAELWAERENPRTRFFSGYGQKLDVAEFIDALDEWEWDFIILDDCFMASVEALYDMRSLADYIIASPTEILMDGFPYDRVVETIFGDWTDVVGVGREFVDYYRTGSYPYATIAVVKMDELDALAEAVRELNLTTNELTSVEGIQFYEGISRPAHLFYDLDDYLINIRKNISPTEYNAFKTQLDRTVIYAGHTPSFYSDYSGGGIYSINDNYSGVNVFIPWSGTASMFDMYRQTAWYDAVYAE